MIQYSFIIPVYNCVNDIQRCVQSILETQVPDLEILLIDDGSTDGSGELCDDLAKKHDVLRSFHQKNSGVSAARNRGLAEASGTWILFADGDDQLESEALGNLLRRLNAFPETDLAVFGMSFDYYYKGKCYRSERKAFPREGCLAPSAWHQAWLELENANYWAPVWNKVYRAEMIRKNGIRFPENMFLYEDFVFSLRCLTYCTDIYVTDDVIYRYRQPEDEKNAARRLLRIPHLNIFIDQIKKELDCMITYQQMKLSTATYLLQLYQMLARIKISVCSVSQIRVICDDFNDWAEQNSLGNLVDSRSYADDLLNRRILRLLRQRYKTAVRHWIAVRMKALGIYPSE